jgi:hypothetical protein
MTHKHKKQCSTQDIAQKPLLLEEMTVVTDGRLSAVKLGTKAEFEPPCRG